MWQLYSISQPSNHKPGLLGPHQSLETVPSIVLNDYFHFAMAHLPTSLSHTLQGTLYHIFLCTAKIPPEQPYFPEKDSANFVDG